MVSCDLNFKKLSLSLNKHAMNLSDFYKTSRREYCEEMCKKDITVKSSNFSIDHILNKAGENISNCCKMSENNVLEESFSNKYSSELLPMFSWLQYTRYRPPKLTRKFQ